MERYLIVKILIVAYLFMQLERDRLLAEVENLSANTDGNAQKMQDVHSQKLKILESQVFLFSKSPSFAIVLLRYILEMFFIFFISPTPDTRS